MSTITLEKLPESVETLAALIREGRRVRVTDKGKLVATVAPAVSKKAPASRRKKPTSASSWELVKHLAGAVTAPGPADLSSNKRHLEGLGE